MQSSENTADIWDRRDAQKTLSSPASSLLVLCIVCETLNQGSVTYDAVINI